MNELDLKAGSPGGYSTGIELKKMIHQIHSISRKMTSSK